MKRHFFCAALVVLGSFSPAFAEEKIVTIGTGAVSGVYYPAGGAICRLMNRSRKDTGIRCFSESTGGSINNIKSLRSGEISFAITQSDWQYKAYNGLDGFNDTPPYTELRSVFSLHSELFTIAVGKNSGIKNLQGLKGKRVNVGDAGSGIREMLEGVLSAFHIKISNFGQTSELKLSDAAQALCDGKIDAMVYAIGHPNGVIQDITNNCGAKLIPIEGRELDTLLAANPYYARTSISAGMYRGNPESIPTFGVKASLITTAAMDDETVYQLTKSVFENFEEFKTLHFVFATLDRERMAGSGLVVPIHPGALRYYKEIGLLKGDAAPIATTPKSE